MDELINFTPEIEVYSIDEAFLDLTGLRKTFNCSYEEITEKIVKDIKELLLTLFLVDD
jgi:nucleotidyltransferase/DNA polymerase involved in DNA repair